MAQNKNVSNTRRKQHRWTLAGRVVLSAFSLSINDQVFCRGQTIVYQRRPCFLFPFESHKYICESNTRHRHQYKYERHKIAASTRVWKVSQQSHLRSTGTSETSAANQQQPQNQENRPLPPMPSELCISLAQSQLELLAHSIERKIKSLALYLPQENVSTGQLEFLPAVIYPNPSTERVFIASGADSGVAPNLPKKLTTLPGFARATTLLPRYPMVSSSSGQGDSTGAGVVEEVFCETCEGDEGVSLSVPLFYGSRTVGALLVSPNTEIMDETGGSVVWTEENKQQIARAAQSLSLALSMDAERQDMKMQMDEARVAMSDSLHQIKNPLQALRTFGKLLQRRIANSDENDESDSGKRLQLLSLAQHLMVQSKRVEDMLVPMDTVVSYLDSSAEHFYLNPSAPISKSMAIEPWEAGSPVMPWETDTLEFARDLAIVSYEAEVFTREPESTIIGENVTEPLHSPNSSKQVWVESVMYKETTPALKTSSNAALTMVGDVDTEMAFVLDVLEPIISAFRAIASERGIKLEVEGENDELPGVEVCPKSLQEAVSNVLDNAFKYVPLPKSGTFQANKFPQVKVRLVANREPYATGVTIVVEDNGPGIRHEDQDSIFLRGFRSDATCSVDGTGIGLDISRTLLSRMGGILQAAEAGKGSLDGAVMKFILFRNPAMNT